MTAVVSLAAVMALGIVWVVPGLAMWLRFLMVPATFAVIVAVAWLSYWWPPVEYRHAAYRVLPDRLEIRRGVVWRTVIAVPRARVQHVDVSQGPFERRYGLGTLSVYTAGTDYSKVDLRGLEHGLALDIRDRLLPADSPDAV